MIQYADLEQRERLTQPLGDAPVGVTGLGHAGGVIVGEDDRPGAQLQRPARYLTRVDRGAVQGATEQRLEADHAVLGIEKQRGELLVAQVAKLGGQVGAHQGGEVNALPRAN